MVALMTSAEIDLTPRQSVRLSDSQSRTAID
jgi:hypothetical protein